MSQPTITNNKIGAHVSIAGGIDMAPMRALEIGCETFQCFTRPPQGGPAPALTEEILISFKKKMEENKFESFYIHTPYYLNLASLDERIWHTSVGVIREDLDRGSLLEARFVMTHIGSYLGQKIEQGIERAIKAVGKILENYNGSTKLLLEISAGAGNIIGDTFDEIGTIVKQFEKQNGFGGVCFDTCHAFASGYDFTTKDKAETMLSEFEKKIGLRWLKLTHINDSKTELGTKHDRHEHINFGHIGENGLAVLLKTPEFSNIDWILETPGDGRGNDIEILKKIRKLN